jgi:HEAT repeat protein
VFTRACKARSHGQNWERCVTPGFIMPALRSADYEHRLYAVSCLAFFGHDAAAVAALPSIAREDAEPGVRQVALWACGLAGVPDAFELLRHASKEDAAPRVRAFATRAMAVVPTDAGGWWRLSRVRARGGGRYAGRVAGSGCLRM